MATDALAGRSHGESLGPGQRMETYTYDDGIVRMFALATVVWALVATLAGLFVALQLVMPEWSFGLSFLTFGRSTLR